MSHSFVPHWSERPPPSYTKGIQSAKSECPQESIHFPVSWSQSLQTNKAKGAPSARPPNVSKLFPSPVVRLWYSLKLMLLMQWQMQKVPLVVLPKWKHNFYPSRSFYHAGACNLHWGIEPQQGAGHNFNRILWKCSDNRCMLVLGLVWVKAFMFMAGLTLPAPRLCLVLGYLAYDCIWFISWVNSNVCTCGWDNLYWFYWDCTRGAVALWQRVPQQGLGQTHWKWNLGESQSLTEA